MGKYLTQKDKQYLFELIKKSVAQFYSQKPYTRKRGRPATYSEEIILNVSYTAFESIVLWNMMILKLYFFAFSYLYPKVLFNRYLVNY